MNRSARKRNRNRADALDFRTLKGKVRKWDRTIVTLGTMRVPKWCLAANQPEESQVVQEESGGLQTRRESARRNRNNPSQPLTRAMREQLDLKLEDQDGTKDSKDKKGKKSSRTESSIGLDQYATPEIGRAVQQECRDRSRMPSSA
eukprot:TRINITY_DN17999_c0_g1_i8.p1 TRINITY_DN17999_c0_g1~~TRINITY_DN17999_c0_g1_i8.p1  ORF type:complete len:146 (-),score=20.20 TRINITY_DN17999_c0_g1_i8:10-447(-)